MSDETIVELDPEQNHDADDAQPVEEQEQVELVEKTPEQKRIDKLTAQKYRERQAREAAEQELAMLKQAQNQNKNETDIESVIEQRVQQRLQQQEFAKREAEFNTACNKTYQTGKAEFSDFDDKINNLSMIGLDRETLDLIATSDHGAKILNFLGEDLEEADRILNLPPLRRARELTKIESTVVSQHKKRISNAPNPISTVSGKGSTSSGDLSDFENYMKWRKQPT